MLNKVKVVICGKEYVMQTAEAPNYVYGLARTLEGRINDMTDSLGVSQYQAAIMTALSTLDDLNKANARLDRICDQSKEYVDDAGRARIERDAAIKEIEVLRSKVAQLENSLKLKKLKDTI
ncbi:MAG: cell division protein ZapA [Oscillospiraceae bacterium]|nr:cell division protein ZapA [Oscillospiraceae bacterium]MBQ8012032.1 cell division protein ZapA [Oscillospiraceae bacterium]MBQ9109753.1 cell division protein ZapA [Oscillospiraceae bacterium]